MASRLLTIDQLAPRLGVSVDRLYVLMRSGHVSGAIKTNDGWLIDKDLPCVLKQLLEERLTD